MKREAKLGWDVEIVLQQRSIELHIPPSQVLQVFSSTMPQPSSEQRVHALFPPASKASDQSKHRWAVFDSETLDLKKIYMQNIVRPFLRQPTN